ncbi:MAG: hypothetical protein IJW23_11325, partial [Lentisphaeria bacterium]|nr:hypothetical protein [Lentisphaeria bacterium]
NFKSLQKCQKILVAICKWSVFGGYPVGSHAQTTISNSSTIFFQPNFAGLLKLPLLKRNKKNSLGQRLFFNTTPLP